MPLKSNTISCPSPVNARAVQLSFGFDPSRFREITEACKHVVSQCGEFVACEVQGCYINGRQVVAYGAVASLSAVYNYPSNCHMIQQLCAVDDVIAIMKTPQRSQCAAAAAICRCLLT